MNSRKIRKKRTMAQYSELGKLIVTAMLDKGIDRKTLLEGLNITTAALTSILFGESMPSLTTAFNLSRTLGIDIELIVNTMNRKDEDTSA